jgi:hypothetical protein
VVFRLFVLVRSYIPVRTVLYAVVVLFDMCALNTDQIKMWRIWWRECRVVISVLFDFGASGRRQTDQY